MSEILLMTKLRDSFQMAADSIQEWLEAQAPKEKESRKEASSWDHSKIKWTQEQGTKGPYEKSEDFKRLDHKALIRELAAHKGKMSHEGLFYW